MLNGNFPQKNTFNIHIWLCVCERVHVCLSVCVCAGTRKESERAFDRSQIGKSKIKMSKKNMVSAKLTSLTLHTLQEEAEKRKLQIAFAKLCRKF